MPHTRLALLLSSIAIITACNSHTIVNKNGAKYSVKPGKDASGTYHRILIDQDIAAGVKAAKMGIKRLKGRVTDNHSDKIMGTVYGQMNDGTKVRITVHSNLTATEIRVFLGNEACATQILQAIAERLE